MNINFSGIIKDLPDPAFGIDTDGKVIFWNKAIEKFTGVKNEDIVGKGNYEYSYAIYKIRRPLLIDLYFNFDEKIIEYYTNIKREENTLTAETKFIHPLSKKETFLWIKVNPIFDEQGNLFGAIELFRDITELKEKERILKESEEKFRDIFDYISDSIFIHNLDGDILDCNLQAVKTYGFSSKEEILKCKIEDLSLSSNGYDQNTALERIQQTLNGNIVTFEWIGRKKDGSIFLEEVTLKKIKIGGQDRILAIVRDVDQKKKIEQALKESEEKFRTFAEASPTGIMVYQDDKFIYVNKAALNMTGYNLNEAMNMKFWDICYPEDLDLILSRAKKRLSGIGGEENYEVRIFDKSGQIRWVYIVSQTISYKGRPAGLTTVLDITDRKKIEEKLFEEKEKLKITLQSIDDAVIVTDTNGIITLINKTALFLTGYEENEAIGKNINEILMLKKESGEEISENLIFEVLKTKKVSQIANNQILISKNGKKYIIEDSASPILDNNGNIFGVILVFRDITEKIKLMDHIQKSQRLESIGILAAGIAHDFNNILEGIYGYIELAKESENISEIKNYLYNSLLSLERAKGLTGQLMTFAKGGGFKTKVQSIEKLIKDTVQFTISGTKVNVKYNFDNNIDMADIDEIQISQVIQNIVINAIQAMENEGTITVSLSNVSFPKSKDSIWDGNYIKISISDDGPGISKEIKDKIFDLFFTTKSSGNGLGLPLCQSIINRHGGFIEFDSEEGKGATFKIYLPVKKESQEQNKSKDLLIKSNFEFKKILVLDDEEVILNILKKMLSKLGFEVFSVSEGNSAIKLFYEEKDKNKPFDFLLFDLTIRDGLGGKDTIKEIRKFDKNVIAIAMTGYSDDNVLKYPQDFGFNDSIAKPFTIDDLKKLLSKFN
ncbi:MAG: PAS domain S-box protein [Spirochaetes bacterium]|nr:PAS domain S-box protein [Spirochaetota bacterium]